MQGGRLNNYLRVFFFLKTRDHQGDVIDKTGAQFFIIGFGNRDNAIGDIFY